MSSPMFRKAALEKLSAPEQLDQLLEVTTPRGWLALAALGGAIVAAILWGFYGRIPKKVEGSGVIIRHGGTFNVVAAHAGRVVDVHVPPDHLVAKGQLIARIAQPELEAQVRSARGELADLVEHKGAADLGVRAAKRKLEALEARLADAESVVSPMTGRILSLQVGAGDLVNVGSILCNLELEQNDLVATLYVAPADAKRIAAGSLVQLSPADIKPAEYGYMLGRVARVSRFPTTEAEMMYLLQNDRLVKLFSSHGAPFGVEVALVRDPATPSGFRWSSAKSPAVTISSGTVCSARIVIGEKRPIDLLIPRLRETIGL